MFQYIDTLGLLNDWLTKLLIKYPNLKDCCIFANGDCLSVDNMFWCTPDGDECPIEFATEVSIFVEEREQKTIPKEQYLLNKLYNLKSNTHQLLSCIESINNTKIQINKVLSNLENF